MGGREHPEALRLRIVELHRAGNGYQRISKTVHIHLSSVRRIVRKWQEFSTVATLPRSGRPAKMTARTQRRLLQEVKKDPTVTSEGLQKSLQTANIFVGAATIRRTLRQNGVHRRRAKRRPVSEIKSKVKSKLKSKVRSEIKPEIKSEDCLEETQDATCEEEEEKPQQTAGDPRGLKKYPETGTETSGVSPGSSAAEPVPQTPPRDVPVRPEPAKRLRLDISTWLFHRGAL